MGKKKKQPRNRIVYKIKKEFLKKPKGEKEFPEIWMSKETRFFDEEGVVPEGRMIMEEHLWNEYQVKQPGEKNPWTRKAMEESGKWTNYRF